MVVIPLKEYLVETTKPVQPGVSRSDIEDPYKQFAKTLEQFGSAADATASSLAEQAGYKAVTRDANGEVQVEKALFVGPAAAHYEHAVKMAALVNYEGDARRTDIKLREEFRNNPEGYRVAADAFTMDLEKKIAASAAGPQVALAVRRAVEQTTTQTYKGLQNEKERLELSRSVNSIDSEIEYTKNQMYAIARGGGADTPEFKAAASKVQTLYGSLGDNPRLAYPAEKIKNELAQFQSELFVQGVAHHVVDDVYASQGYDAAERVAADIRTNPKLNLSPQQRDTAYSRIMSELNAKARDDMRVTKSIAGDIKNIGDMAIQGYTVPPERIGQVRAAIQTARRPELEDALRNTEAVAATMKQWSQMNPTQLEASIGQLDKTMGDKGATEEGLALKAAGQKLLKNMRDQVGKDPLGWADRTGVMPVPEIKFGTPDAPAQMQDRVTRAEMVAQQYGVKPTYLRPSEVSTMEIAGAAGGDAMIGVARTLVDGFGDRAPKVMSEISTNAPVLAHVGALMQSGGNAAFALDVADASKMRSDKEFKLPNWMAKPSDKVMQIQGDRTRDVYGSAFALSPDAGRAAEQAAKDAFFTRAVRSGYVPTLDAGDSKKVFDRSLQESVGAKWIDGTQYGGIGDYKPGYWSSYKVLVPPTVKSDSFRDIIGAISNDDLSKMGISPVSAGGQPYTAADIRAAVPVATRNGYRFAVGDPNSTDPKYIRGADGKPWVLDFDQMEERLRARVPSAFLGGGGGSQRTPSNFEQAQQSMGLSPQESALYQRHLTNLTGPGGVDNENGSRSTLYQMSFERDGKTYNIPTVWDGKILKPDEAIKRAEKEGLNKFPSYASEAEAEDRYQKMHDFMERDTAEYFAKRKRR